MTDEPVEPKDERPVSLKMVQEAVAAAKADIEEHTKARKIIGLFSREPFTPPVSGGTVTEEGVEELDDEEKNEPDQSTVQLLEMALEAAKAGEILGCVILGGAPDGQGGVLFVRVDVSDSAIAFDQTFIGACSTASIEIMRMADQDLMDEFEEGEEE